MSLRVRLSLMPPALVAIAVLAACQRLPPAITGVTIFPADAQGTPLGVMLCRTRLQPPIPVIAMRPGDDPAMGGLFLNEPTSGDVAVTLARGEQSFLLYTAFDERSAHYVIAIYVDHEALPALSSVVDADLSHPVRPSQAAVVAGIDGTLVTNHTADTVRRDGFRVSLRRAAFALAMPVDSIGPWRLEPDGLKDHVGVISVEVAATSS